MNLRRVTYQPRSNLVKYETMFADSHNILSRSNYFCQLLGVNRVYDVRKTEINTAELLKPAPSSSDIDTAIEKSKGYKPPRTNQILAETIQAAGNTLRSESHKFINFYFHNHL